MTVEQAIVRLADVAAMAMDPEAAHSAEDQFHVDVLQAIAKGAERPQALAKVALRTTHVEFERWCA